MRSKPGRSATAFLTTDFADDADTAGRGLLLVSIPSPAWKNMQERQAYLSSSGLFGEDLPSSVFICVHLRFHHSGGRNRRFTLMDADGAGSFPVRSRFLLLFLAL